MKKTFLFLVALCAIVSCGRPLPVGEFTADVNGVSLLYEVQGQGRPVILLHGNGGSHHDLDTLSAQMVRAGYRVYALDSRGQGANELLPEYHYADMAEDVWQFCGLLGIERPIVYGWSDGGIVALELELAHPGTVSLMAISGANISVDCMEPGVWEEIYGDSDPSDPLIAMMLREPRIEPSALEAIDCPVLVCAGEDDLISYDHTCLIANHLPHSTLCIVPGENHGSYIWHNPRMGEILLEFIDRQ